MAVAYLINQYPKVSHSFIRREIIGLEKCGIPIIRYAIRDCAESIVDEADRLELKRTRVLLNEVSLVGLLSHLLLTFVRSPIRWLRCFTLLLKLSRWSQKSLAYHMAYLAEACIILRWCKQADITHIHTHFGTNGTEVAMLIHLLGGPTYSFTVHGPTEFDQPMMLSLKEKINRAKFVIAVSSFGKSQLCRWCGYQHWQKIKVVHCGVDHTFLEAPNQPISPVPTFVCVGRLVEQKGQLLLLEAASRLAQKGRTFKLFLVGDGPLRSQLETLIDRFNLSDKVTITGWANGAEVRRLILMSRALVLPSFAEGLPVVLMEALALRRPVISTYIAGIPELVEPGESGWLIPSGSVNALADAMDEVLTRPKESLEAMGKIGAQRVAQEYNAAIEAQKIAQLLKEQMGEVWISEERAKDVAMPRVHSQKRTKLYLHSPSPSGRRESEQSPSPSGRRI
ncbi:MAG: glycosyltransferase family 4 protein [Cyanobacteria bacterium J06607_10]